MKVNQDETFRSITSSSIISEPPQPNKKCPRKNGFFPHPDNSICDVFYNCIDGESVEITCTTGLHFDEYSGICVWPDNANRQVVINSNIFYIP